MCIPCHPLPRTNPVAGPRLVNCPRASSIKYNGAPMRKYKIKYGIRKAPENSRGSEENDRKKKHRN